MSKEAQKSNFELAQEEANKIDLQIIDTLQKGYNFRVEAGAGSGKTYSLNKVIEWIQVNNMEAVPQKEPACSMYYLYKCRSGCYLRTTYK